MFLNQVESCKILDYKDIPGAPQPKVRKPRMTKEQKAAAAAAPVASVAPAIPGQQDLSSIVGQAPAPAAVAAPAAAQPSAEGFTPATPAQVLMTEHMKGITATLGEIAQVQSQAMKAQGELMGKLTEQIHWLAQAFAFPKK